MMGVPTFYTRLLDTPGFTRDLAAPMRVFISGSAPLLPQTFAAFEERTGHAILERYGMTEAGMIASNPYGGARVAGTVGYPLPDTEARIQGGGAGPGVLEISGGGRSEERRVGEKLVRTCRCRVWTIDEKKKKKKKNN